MTTVVSVAVIPRIGGHIQRTSASSAGTARMRSRRVPERGPLPLNPDGGTLAVGTEAGTIYLWDLSSGELLATLAA